MRKLAGIVAVLIAGCLALAGCGAAGNSNEGKYLGYATTIFGQADAMEETYSEGENYLELKGDGAAVLCLDGETTDVTYEIDGTNITITIADEDSNLTSEGTIENGVITIDYLGMGLELTFVKDGVEKPFELGTTVSTDDVSADTTTDDTAEETDGDATDQSDETDDTEDVDVDAVDTDDAEPTDDVDTADTTTDDAESNS